jgi:LacI family transcriptional regulator
LKPRPSAERIRFHAYPNERYRPRPRALCDHCFQGTPRPDVIFCFNDHVAMGAMQALLDAGLRIPADIALMGCGNIHFDDYLRVPLSSMDQQSAAIGIRAARLAINLVKSDRPVRRRTILLEPRLFRRDSKRC